MGKLHSVSAFVCVFVCGNFVATSWLCSIWKRGRVRMVCEMVRKSEGCSVGVVVDGVRVSGVAYGAGICEYVCVM